MAKRGDQARNIILNKIIDTFKQTNDFITFKDKKIIVQADDGEFGNVQVAITLTVPKTNIAEGSPSATTTSPIELSEEDKAMVSELKKKLGIID